MCVLVSFVKLSVAFMGIVAVGFSSIGNRG